MSLWRKYTKETAQESMSRHVGAVVCAVASSRSRWSTAKRSPPTIHQSLCHPHIVSVYSVFATSTEHFQVLELCPNRDLASFIQFNHVLEEAELRGVLLNLVDALSYLRKQRIIHRAIEPKHVLVTNGYHTKLGHFDQAIELPFGNTMSKEFCLATVYSSPEIIYQRPYTYSADIWSLGCLIIACTSSMKLPEVNDYSRTLKLRNAVPSNLVSQCSELVTKILQPDASRRISLGDISYHPFLSRELPVSALVALKSNMQEASMPNYSNTGILQSNSVQEQRLAEPNTALRREKPAVLSCGSTQDLTKPTNLATNPRSSLPQHDTPPQATNSNYDSALRAASQNAKPEPKVSIGTTRPEPFNTNSLQPQTKKVADGQLMILPSLSVLIDFREGQRRAGKSGTQVLVVSDDGNIVKIYDAPHLSTPCCLVEPVGTYALSSLPSRYWETYNDAGTIIDQMKSKTPKLVLHSPTAKCTLMTNSPQADIELLFFENVKPASHKPRASDKSASPNVRILLSRHSGYVEFAHRLKSPQGEEWTKKNLLWSGMTSWVDSLSNDERNALDQLLVFLKSCEAVEMAEASPDPTPSSDGPNVGIQLKRTTKPKLNIGKGKENIAPSGTSIERERSTRSSSTLHSLRLPPRPRIVSSSTTVKPSSRSASSSALTPKLRTASVDKFEITPNMSISGVETKFLPDVGWCVRHASTVSQGGRYRILFFDGVSVDVDVDEEWVEVKDFLTGTVTRHAIAECHVKRDVGDRMKVFKEFVSMFGGSE